MIVEVRDKILEASSTLFTQYGVRSITMDEIARHLAVSKKTIYQYFHDKDELVSEVILRDLNQDKLLCEDICGKAANSIEELFEISNFFRRRILKINPSLLFDIQKFHSNAWEIYLDFKENVFLESLKKSLYRGIKEGFIRDDINPEILATLRMEEVQMSFDESIFPRDRFDFREVQIQFYDHFVNGIITEKGRKLITRYSDKMTIK